VKLILAIVNADAAEAVSKLMVDHKFAVTQLSSVGGFLRRGSATLVIGVVDSQLQEAMRIIRDACGPFHTSEAHPATIFVLEAAEFTQF